jgi:hypothetical protein
MNFDNCKMVFRVIDPVWWQCEGSDWDVNGLDGCEILEAGREEGLWDITLEEGTRLFSIRGIHITLEKVNN